MKKRIQKKLPLHRETLLQLGRAELKPAVAGTLTYEGSCCNSFCPCATDGCAAE